MSASRNVLVDLGERSYPVWIGEQLLPAFVSLQDMLSPYSKRFIVADAAVVELYAEPLLQSWQQSGLNAHLITIPSGEGSKSFAQLEFLLETILSHQPDRKTVLLAMGGGVVGDLVGLAASLLLRGVDFIQIPTTLLAMVDSSVGGKTAINSKAGKNLVGAFYQPKAVLADIHTLSSLPAREWQAGYAEVVKYGLIRDVQFFDWLDANHTAWQQKEASFLVNTIERCVAMKAAVVRVDETEQDVRALLNFGHTLGHAIEAETGFSQVLHGEAVAVGMVLAAKLSVHMGCADSGIISPIIHHLKTAGLPTHLTDIRAEWSIDALIRHCYGDKKAEHGRLTFILLRGLGEAFVEKHAPEDAVRHMLQQELA